MTNIKQYYEKRRTRVSFKPDENGTYRLYEYQSAGSATRYYATDKESTWHRVKSAEPGILIRVRDRGIVGTALAAITALLQFWSNITNFWNWPKDKVHDGYALTLLSPFVWLYWLALATLYTPILCAISGLEILAVIWTFTFEYPAALLNGEGKPRESAGCIAGRYVEDPEHPIIDAEIDRVGLNKW